MGPQALFRPRFLCSGMTVLWKPFGRGWDVEPHNNPQSVCTFFLQLVERKLGAGCLRTLGRPWGNMPCPTSPSRPRAHWANPAFGFQVALFAALGFGLCFSILEPWKTKLCENAAFRQKVLYCLASTQKASYCRARSTLRR